MAATIRINLGVGGYSIPNPCLLMEVIEETSHKQKAVVSFFVGRDGRAIARARDNRVILPARGAPVAPGDVWEGTLVLGRTGRFYIFYPERPIKAAKYSSVPPHCYVYVNGQLRFALVRVKTARGEEGVVKVMPLEHVDIRILLASVAAVASRFDVVDGLLDYEEALKSIQGLKKLYGALAVSYDSKALREVFSGVPQKPKLPHVMHVWRREGNVLRCQLCGEWKPYQRRIPDPLVSNTPRKRGRFTPRRLAVRRWERPFWSTKGLHRRKVVHTRKSHRTRAQMKRRAKRTTKRHGTPAMWRSRNRW